MNSFFTGQKVGLWWIVVVSGKVTNRWLRCIFQCYVTLPEGISRNTWRIIPVGKCLMTMVSPLSRVVPLLNGLNGFVNRGLLGTEPNWGWFIYLLQPTVVRHVRQAEMQLKHLASETTLTVQKSQLLHKVSCWRSARLIYPPNGGFKCGKSPKKFSDFSRLNHSLHWVAKQRVGSYKMATLPCYKWGV